MVGIDPGTLFVLPLRSCIVAKYISFDEVLDQLYLAHLSIEKNLLLEILGTGVVRERL